MMVSRRSDSPESTEQLAGDLASRLCGGEVIALRGELGAGKTTFVRGLARGLGIEPRSVVSPTFVICREYAGRELGLIHIDVYRLNFPDELDSIGWDEILTRQQTVVAVEWSELIQELLPKLRTIAVTIDHDEDARLITIEAPENLSDRTLPLRASSRPCRTCQRPVAVDHAWFPFCSERCRLVDLGQWFNESYRISRPLELDENAE